jgi:predicted Rossmann fold flavoprotein
MLLANYSDAKKYLHSAFARFGVPESVQFFKELGIELKVEDRKRAFPKSEKAIDVFNALYNVLEKHIVEVRYGAGVKSLKYEDDGVVNIETAVGTITTKKLIIASGGYSHPETGSTGDGFVLLQQLSSKIQINKPNPSLVPILSGDRWVHSLSGKTIENIKLTIKVDGASKSVLKFNPKSETKNRVLFTHFGLSGPTILNNSKKIRDYLAEGDVSIWVDLFPALNEKELDQFLLGVFEGNKNKKIRNVLNEIYPGNILETICERFIKSLDLDMQVNELKKEERKTMLQLLKNLEITVKGLMGYENAIVADGGVDPAQVNFEDMSLKDFPSIRVTGDMLDISRPSGGYSLQLCWTTGYIAGTK